MFHTSYSLIFVSMLYDYYLFTADINTVKELLPAVDLLLERFASYTYNSVIENAPNYMFIDWGNIDGYEMHHPPKALGQTAMNAFYNIALTNVANLYAAVGDTFHTEKCRNEAKKNRTECYKRFWDSTYRCFFDGDSAPSSVNVESEWLPLNPTKRYHTKHANALAVLAGFVTDEQAQNLIERIVEQDSLDGTTILDVQPYFMHYVLEAVRKTGLFGKYGLRLIHLWDKQGDL